MSFALQTKDAVNTWLLLRVGGMIRFPMFHNFGVRFGCDRLALELNTAFLDSVTGASIVLLCASSFHCTRSRSLSSSIAHRRWIALWPRCLPEYSLLTLYHTSVVKFNIVFTVAEYKASSKLCLLSPPMHKHNSSNCFEPCFHPPITLYRCLKHR